MCHRKRDRPTFFVGVNISVAILRFTSAFCYLAEICAAWQQRERLSPATDPRLWRIYRQCSLSLEVMRQSVLRQPARRSGLYSL
jgi:hypothetical protein